MSARPTVVIDSAMSASELRARCREGIFSGPTSGHAYGMVQTNLMIVPKDAAFDFLLFCERNPKPCPLIEVLEAGVYTPRCAPPLLGLLDQSVGSQFDRSGDGFVTQAAIELGGDAIPIIAFSEHGKYIFDKDTRALERQLTATDLRVSDDVLSKFFAFACSHDVLRTCLT